MTKKPKLEPDDKEQSRRFEETARSLGTDESEKTFERTIGIVVPSKPAVNRSRPSGRRSSS